MNKILLIISLICFSNLALAKEKTMSKKAASLVVLFCPFCLVEAAKGMEKSKAQPVLKRTLSSTPTK